jgi:hypothetical protein
MQENLLKDKFALLFAMADVQIYAGMLNWTYYFYFCLLQRNTEIACEASL